jgi:hypothetical protein
VANHPSVRASLPFVKVPMEPRSCAMNMIMNRNGAARSPLMRAEKTRSLTASTPTTAKEVPPIVPRIQEYRRQEPLG